jgi:hypothetical protein
VIFFKGPITHCILKADVADDILLHAFFSTALKDYVWVASTGQWTARDLLSSAILRSDVSGQPSRSHIQVFGSPGRIIDPWRRGREVVPKRRYGITTIRCVVSVHRGGSLKPRMGRLNFVSGNDRGWWESYKKVRYVCGQDATIQCIKTCGTYSCHRDLKGSAFQGEHRKD